MLLHLPSFQAVQRTWLEENMVGDDQLPYIVIAGQLAKVGDILLGQPHGTRNVFHDLLEPLPVPLIEKIPALQGAHEGLDNHAARPVLSPILVLIHPVVRFPEERLHIRGGFLVHRVAYGQGNRNLGVEPGVLLCRVPQALNQALGFIKVHIRHDNGEFVSPDPRDDVAGAKVLLQELGRPLDHFVALGVPQGIVDELHLVQVAKEKPHAMAWVLLETMHFLLEEIAVVQAGQGVVKACIAELVLHPNPFRDVDDSEQGQRFPAAGNQRGRHQTAQFLVLSLAPHIQSALALIRAAPGFEGVDQGVLDGAVLALASHSASARIVLMVAAKKHFSEGSLAQPVLGNIEKPCGKPVRRADHQVTIHHQHDQRRVLIDRPKLALFLHKPLLGHHPVRNIHQSKAPLLHGPVFNSVRPDIAPNPQRGLVLPHDLELFALLFPRFSGPLQRGEIVVLALPADEAAQGLILQVGTDASQKGHPAQVATGDDSLVIDRDIAARGELVQILELSVQSAHFLLGIPELLVLDLQLGLVHLQLVHEL